MTWLKKRWRYVVILAVVAAGIGIIVVSQLNANAEAGASVTYGDEGTQGSSTEAGAPGDGASVLPVGLDTGGLPMLLDLGSDSCAPCKMMVPELAALAEEYHGVLKVVVIDVYENQGLARSFQLRAIPTQLFLDAEGRELGRHIGFMSKDQMAAAWKDLGVDLDEAKADGDGSP